MPPPSKQDRRIHAAFLRRQKVYENRYIRRFLAILAKQYREAANVYPAPYTVNPNDYRQVLFDLYTTALPSEARIAWETYVTPLLSEQKDFFDDIAAILGFDIPKGEHIRLWRDISREWLSVNILTKIQSLARTTQRAIAKIIESAISEGLSERDIAKQIRDRANGTINKERAKLIARTESLSALNKGRRISMYTSNLLWDKKWVDTPDERTRSSHRIVANDDPIPLDEDYILNTTTGGTEPAQCPGDPGLSAENICNCRCVETYTVQRDANGRPRRRQGTPIRVSEAAELI